MTQCVPSNRQFCLILSSQCLLWILRDLDIIWAPLSRLIFTSLGRLLHYEHTYNMKHKPATKYVAKIDRASL
ncbi:hypothetical protein PNOK_0568600 [Pyrrhoderma noxium]|uniref:Uncharacterized protein n=1 Tax=Pyrrhoderma noxium TaxID=2282107 RepID=A0A286UGX1_9AGAM|nr:hypothetical protein PNOK_0568600 [Pyrrhoderma noxium]